MYCRNCGKQIGENMSFCFHCGAEVTVQSDQEAIKKQQAHEAWKAQFAAQHGIEPNKQQKHTATVNSSVLPQRIPPQQYTVYYPAPVPVKKSKPTWAIVLLVICGIFILGALAGETKDSEKNTDTLDSSVQKANDTSQSTDPNSEPAISEEEYKALCQVIDYKELCRYPDNYIGQKICIKVKLFQIMDVGGFLSEETAWRGYTDNSGHEFYFDDEYYLLDKRPDGAVKVLVDDIVIVYGEYAGTRKITRALTSTQDELPCIEVKYVEIVE